MRGNVISITLDINLDTPQTNWPRLIALDSTDSILPNPSARRMVNASSVTHLQVLQPVLVLGLNALLRGGNCDFGADPDPNANAGVVSDVADISL
jgi:hypothetical protein